MEHRIGVRKYVVEHKYTWVGGETLVDVTGDGSEAFELDAVQGFCTNEAPWLVWPRQKMVAGCYDCIIDVDADGKYTKGVDFVDNINLSAQATCGMRVASTSCTDSITLTKPTDGESVDTTTATIEGTLSAAGSSGSVTITSGNKSNRVNLDVSTTTISATIPLFHGENLITVAVVKADNTTRTKTIKVTSTAESSADELFRAQLTWAAGDDMDLHVLKPGATASSTGDCNYANCKVPGSGLDWGVEGKPKLDIDCRPVALGCTTRIENIWVNDINQSGVYTVYVHAYAGDGTAVNGSIFIRGTQVAIVPCGTLTANNWCKVGTINWSGGTTGGGAFTPSGSVSGTAP